MNILEKVKKIRSWPDKKKKIFLWAVGIILGLILFIIWLKMISYKLAMINQLELKKQFNLPELNLPFKKDQLKLDLLQDLDFKKIKEIEEILEELSTNSNSSFE